MSNIRGASELISRSFYRLLLSVFGLSFMGASVLMLTSDVNATDCSIPPSYYGYYDNICDGSNSPYPDSRGPVIDNNDYATDAIPSSVTDGSSLYTYLYDKYHHTGTYGVNYGHTQWDSTGVSFIVNTMLGRSGSGASRSISSSDWTELQNRLLSPLLKVTPEFVSTSTYGDINTYYQFVENDVAYYPDTDSGEGIVIRDASNRVVYVLLYSCANPVGKLAGLPKANIWTISTSSSASVKTGKTYAEPGDTVTWTHTVKNNGPDATDKNVSSHYVSSGSINGVGPATTLPSGTAAGGSKTYSSSYIVQQSDVGNQVCRSTVASPKAWNDSGTVESAPACISVLYQYQLTPSVSLAGSGGTMKSVEPGSSVTIDYSVSNKGITKSRPTQWQLARCAFSPGAGPASMNALPDSGADGVASYSAPNVKCATAESANGVIFDPGSNTTLTPPVTETIGNLPAGTHICYVLSVNPAGNQPGSTTPISLWRHSTLACISVVKVPKLQVTGGDIRAGSITTLPPSQINGKYYGSWGEYGVFGINQVENFASAAAYVGGGSTNTTAAMSLLTFANTSPSALGNFEPAQSLNYAQSFTSAPSKPLPSTILNNLANGTYTTGSLNVTSGGTIQDKKNVVIIVNGNLTINENITYSGVYGSEADIPRIVFVVSKDIIVSSSVTQIDAWLIAQNGKLFTCSDDKGNIHAQLTLKDCGQQLVFNGPVVVKSARLSRTYGADSSAGGSTIGEGAEVFNLRPDIFLSSYQASLAAGKIQTVYEKELPPRW